MQAPNPNVTLATFAKNPIAVAQFKALWTRLHPKAEDLDALIAIAEKRHAATMARQNATYRTLGAVAIDPLYDVHTLFVDYIIRALQIQKYQTHFRDLYLPDIDDTELTPIALAYAKAACPR